MLLLLAGSFALNPQHAAAAGGGLGACYDVSHDAVITIGAFDASTGASVTGATITESRPANKPAVLQNRYCTYIDDSGQPGHSPNVATTSGPLGEAIVYDNCNQSIPYMRQAPPTGSGDTFNHAVLSVNGQSVTINSGTQAAFQTALNQLWQNGAINTSGGLLVSIYYNVPPGNNWQLAPAGNVAPTTVSSISTSVTFGNSINNTGPDKATYSYQVQKRYNNQADSYNGGWSNATFSGASGSESNVANGATVPDLSNNYNFPSGAKSGDSYCERITYTNGNGPSDTSTSDGQENCVTYSPGGGGTTCNGSSCPSNVACTEDEHNLAPNSVYRFTLYDSGGGSGYVTSAPVPVTQNSNGDYVSNSTYGSRGSWASLKGGNAAQQDFTNSTGNTEPNTFVYPPPSGPDAYTVIERWADNSGNWTYSYKVEGISNCYAATCSIGIDGNVPNGPGDALEAGSAYTATATIDNTGVQPLTALNWSGTANTGTNPSQGISIGGGSSAGVDMNPGPTAPASIGSYSEGGAVYSGSYQVAGCTPANANVYQHFTLVPTANIGNGTDPQNPTVINYNTTVTQGPDTNTDPYTSPVASNIKSQLNYTPVGGAASTVDQHPDSGNYGTTTYSYTYNGPNPNHFQGQAGDQYCPILSIDNATGWIGPSNSEVDQASATSSGGCLTVSNRPFFKTYNGSISAGGSFKALNASGHGGGELAGWNNNTGVYPTVTSGDYGSSAQLNALALTQIVGFASGQGYRPVNFGATDTTLTFADNPETGDNYNPTQGGAFEPGGNGYYLNDQQQPTGGDTSTSMPALPLTVPAGDQKSVFITGNAYISGNIVYSNSGGGWTLAGSSQVPSFVLHATGNIYIDPSVTELDGLYIAQGEIYTCANSSGAIAATAEYSTCNQQLTVNGSFVAGQVNLGRTYGSLRDETPIPGSTIPVPPTQVDTSAVFNRYYCGAGQPGDTLGVHFYQNTANNEPATPSNTPAGCGLEGPMGYILPAPGGSCDTPGAIPLWYINGVPGVDNNFYTTNPAEPHNAIIGCVPAGQAANTEPVYRFYNPNSGNHFYSTSSDEAPATTAPNIEHDGIQFYVYTSAGQGGMTVTHPPRVINPRAPTPADLRALNGGTGCSNAPFGFVPLAPQTCAAEVFNFSPELYLSSPNVAPPSAGSAQWDAVTSLPPVL